MVEFRTEYYTPMDRGYHERIELEPARPETTLEQPVFPISQIGQTVPEHDPTGRFKNMLQTVQAAIRGGTGNIQIVFQTPLENAVGGRPKAYGEEVRRAIKEVAMANEVMFTGMEMPTSLSNLSGWDAQRSIIDEEKRQRDLDEVKEMIKFAADVGQGGGIDVLSWEYDRPIHRADWWKPGSKEEKAFKRLAEEEKRHEVVRFVDIRSGQVSPIPIREGIPMFIKKINGKYVEVDPTVWVRNPKTGKMELPKPDLWKYDDFKEFAEAKKMSVAEAIKRHFLDEQLKMAKAQAGYYHDRYNDAKEAEQHFARIVKAVEAGEEIPEELVKKGYKTIQALKEKQKFYSELANSFKAGLEEQRRIELQTEQRIESWKPMEEITVKRSKESYAEAAITAMQMQDRLGPKNIKHDLYVGPEIGWPQFYGSHPKEFVDMIRGSREIMVKMLTNDKEYKGKYKEFGLKEPMSRAEAEEEAKRHIKGMLDTSHLGMWLQNFHPEMPWDKRIKEFSKWYKEQIEWLAKVNKKEQIIGGIQAVDSAGAAHGHLPPGQGILPVKEAVEILRQKGGFTGYLTSEGHEEEKFGEGRILLKTWQHFNAPIATGYGPGVPVQRAGGTSSTHTSDELIPLCSCSAHTLRATSSSSGQKCHWNK
ncbi:MAG: hypothetical protein QXT19_04225 [Candidatus Woesearchaeota archaeon]